MSTLVQADARRRLTLPTVNPSQNYLVHTEPDGSIVLEPAVVMSQTEYELRRIAPRLHDEVMQELERPFVGGPRKARPPRD